MPEGDWSSLRTVNEDHKSIRNDHDSPYTDSKDTQSIFDEKATATVAKVEEENSLYEEVRAAVPNTDTEMPCNTIRAWTLGLIMSFFGAAVNTILSLRSPVIGIGVIVAQEFTTFGSKWSINPGPFNVKEHALIVVMANVSFGVAYATDIILAQKIFCKQDFGIAFQLLLTITTSSIGYGIAGIMRHFLIYPAAMIWPNNLVSVSLLHAMHEKNEDRDPTVFGGFLAQFLSICVFITWIFPQNPVVNQVFGGTSGLGLVPLTFDWTIVTGFTGNPMIPPWHAIANTMIGVFIFSIFGSLGLHYSGAWYAKFLPMSDSTTYDNMGVKYNTTRVVTPRLTLDEQAYKEYSPLFISTTFALSYDLSFATIASVVVYTALNYGPLIVSQFKNSQAEKPDIHAKLMRKYKEAPEWWYGALFLLMFILSLVTVVAYPTEFAWWAFILAIAFSTVMALPIGTIQAITNLQIGLNVITEFIMGYMQPGKPLALMMFKMYGYITASRALGFVDDLKFGHYMKIPLFAAQVVATTLSCFVQVAVLNFALGNIEGICDLDQKQRFSCPGGRVFFSASVIWGLLGPQRMFSPGQIYSALLFFFPAGAIITVILHFVGKKVKVVRYAMAPLIFGGSQGIPPASPLNFLT
ncbi:small oligopeptide transporter [Byssothecium circinans]|uniref:Small oligopeptide transporter n=1 Tax=Byssothecium circinans TaxID=147558 RepID=A0A6A5TLA0_9PLEO|nr:small oligopeptide transporter [Byssothecium circinans]